MGNRSRLLFVFATLAGGCANDPQYVDCGTSGVGMTTMDKCVLDSAMATGSGASLGSGGALHVPVRPETADLTKARMALQATMPADVMVPMYRLDEYDLSVDFIVKNLDAMPTQVKVELNGANEVAAWDPSKIVPASDESPPTPGLGGDVPLDVPANGEYDGQFREDQLLEAAIDLDQISRGNINPFAATLIVNKNDPSFQPLSAQLPPPAGSNDPPMQNPMGSAVPRAAFRQLVRVNVVLKPLDPAAHTTLEFSLRVRPHNNDVIHTMGMDAPTGEITVYDPPAYIPAYTP